MKRVVVTGIGVASPLGCTVEDFWKALLEGQSGVVALTGEDFSQLPTRIGALVTGFNPDDYFSRKEQRRMSRSSQLALAAAKEAVVSAALDGEGINAADVGVIIGSSIGGFSASDGFFKDYYLHGRAGPLIIPISMNNGPSTNVSIRYGFQGPVMTIDAACASAAHSIAYAYNLIRTGMQAVMVTGGADSPFSPGVVRAWCSLRALSERNETPGEACRPFSADRDGLVLGEGAAVLVLESETSAIRRNRPIIAEIIGYGATADSYHLTQPTPEGPIRSMKKALEDAGIPPQKVDYINAHGTGTRWNDFNETVAIKELFGAHAYKIPVVTNKAALGHSIGASGALELISCILSLRDQIVPPTINYSIPDPECDLNYVTDGSIRCELNTVMSNSFAFGGSNATLIVSKYSS